MITMNNSLVNPLHCQQKTQNYMICALQVVSNQRAREHANDSLDNDITTFDGKP